MFDILQGSVRGWDRGPEKLYLTLDRSNLDTAWGFSCSGGQDLELWGAVMSGVAARRHERGLWVSVASVMSLMVSPTQLVTGTLVVTSHRAPALSRAQDTALTTLRSGHTGDTS